MGCGRGDRDVVLIVVDGLVLGRRLVTARRVKPAMIEPVDVLQGGQFQLVQAAPRSVTLYQLGLVQAVHRFGECVIVRISFTASRNGRARFGEALGVTDGEVLPVFNWWLQHRWFEGRVAVR